MNVIICKLLLALSALILAVGASMHGAAFRSFALPKIDHSNLTPAFAAQFKTLWLADSTTLFSLAFVFAAIAVNPTAASRGLIMLLALPTAAETILIYYLLGPFFAGHILLAASAFVFIAGLLAPSTQHVG